MAVAWLTPAFWQAEPLEGRVHTCFEHAVNFLFRVPGGERMLTLLAPDAPRVPDAIRLTEGWPPPVAVGDAALLTARQVSVKPGCSIEFLREPWNGRIPARQGVPKVAELIALCAGLHNGLSGLPVALRRQAYAAVAAGDARRWLGLGPGLTPAFDDLCVGAMAARQALGDGRPFLLPELSRTTEISARYLTLAAEGYFSEPLGDVTAALFGEGNLSRAVGRLVTIGATSGADMLTGVRLVVCGVSADDAMSPDTPEP